MAGVIIVTLALGATGAAGAKQTVTSNAPTPKGPKVVHLKIARSTAPSIVALRDTTCTYDPQTHMVHAGGALVWVPPTGGGALGTISATWTAPAKRTGHAKKGSPKPLPYTLSATTSEFFSGLWTLAEPAMNAPTACSVTASFMAPTAESVTAYLTAKGIPITGVISYNASTDPNHLLGRPAGYLSKTAWQDTRIDQTDQSAAPGGVQWGGSIEVFSTAAQANSRATYLGTIQAADSVLVNEYDYLLGPILVRVSGTFIPTTAATYQSALPGSSLYTPTPPGAPATTTTAP
jgi:hypothetical protein